MLSAPEIQSKLYLPYTPTDYTTATIPAGTEMYTGTVAPLNPDPTSGIDRQPGGATQWQVKTGFDQQDFQKMFSDSAPIPQTTAPEAPLPAPTVIPETPVITEVPMMPEIPLEIPFVIP
jgi:hypothetical protein